jgi:GT2 family glycosyltransferase
VSALPPRASIVIVTYGQRALTEACLLSLQASLGDELGRGTEVIVVDNASPDDTLVLLRDWEDRITVLAQAENHNFSGGCNIGARAARGEVLIFLNNDTVVEAGVLEALAETVREPGVGAAGLRLLYPDGSLQHAGFHMVNHPGTPDAPVPHHLLYRHDGEHPAGRAIYEMDCVTGACLAIPRALFEQLGGFDEAFVNGAEDVDLCFKVRASGHAIVYRGDLTVEHHEGGTRGTDIDGSVNMARLHARWGAMMEQDDELATQVWDGALGEPMEVRGLPGREIVVAGDVTGIGPAADEARGLLLAFERAGRPAVGIDLTPNRLRARLSGDLGSATIEAFVRQVPVAPWLRIDVPYGAAWAAQVPADALLRARREAPDGRADGVVPAAPADGDAWIAPAIDLPAPVGPGGGGVLVALPAHDHSQSAALLSALANADLGGAAVRLVPTVLSRGLEALVAERLPGAELLGPISEEARWIALAGTADVAVCLDLDDRFDRRALAGAGAGASVLIADPDGPAAAVLGDAAIVATPATLPDALASLLPPAPERRDAVAAPVREACAPERVGRAILALAAQPAAALSAV